MHGARPPTDSSPPHLRDLYALRPLLVLDVVLVVWLWIHASSLAASVGLANAGLAGIVFVVKMLPDNIAKEASESFAKRLQSRGLARLLWGGVALLVALTAFVSTVHVSVNKDAPSMTLYRVDLPHGPAPTVGVSGATITDSTRFDRDHDTPVFFVRLAPFSRWVQIHSSMQLAAKEPVHVVPWLPSRLTYPDDFASLVVASVLPDLDLMSYMQGQGLRILMRDAAHPATVLAEDTLHTMGALRFAFTAATAPDSATRKRWMQVAAEAHPGADTTTLATFVQYWMAARWVRTRAPLTDGLRVEVVAIAPPNDTVAVGAFTLSGANADVILHRP